MGLDIQVTLEEGPPLTQAQEHTTMMLYCVANAEQIKLGQIT